MPAPTTTLEFLDLVKKSGIVNEARYSDVSSATLPPDVTQAANLFIQRGWLTKFQAKQLLAGRHKGFRIGSYVIKELLGHGGMGIVYLGEHQTLQRPVALKVLSEKAAEGNNTALVRFLREARSAAALDHPNIVRIHDVGQSNNTHYLVMEYVEGRTLDTMVTAGGALSTGRAVEYIAQAAAGLAHAHDRGFVHRDIKPANLILNNEGVVKILDMGLARSFDDPNDKLTSQLDKGAVLGTADFIAPEQALNEPHVDARADIYSLGATFYALVCGHSPFQGSTTQKLMQHQMKDAPELKSLDKTFPEELSDVIAKMMAKSPGHRYQSMEEVIDALTPWMSEAPPSMSGPLNAVTKKIKAKPQSKKKAINKVPTWAVVAISVVGLGLVGMAVNWAWKQKPDPKTVVVEQPLSQNYQQANAQPKSTTPAKTQPAKTNTPKPVPVSTPLKTTSKELYSLDIKNHQPSIARYECFVDAENKFRTKIISKTTDTPLPTGWIPHIVKNGAIAEFLTSDDTGVMALGIRTISGGGGAMLFTPEIKFLNAKNATITFETSGTMDNFAGEVKFRPQGKAAYILKKFTANTKWSTVTVPLTLDKENSGAIEFIHYKPESDATLWIKDLKITAEVPATGSANSTTNTNTTKTTTGAIFTFNASGVGDFRFSRSNKMDSGGTKPIFPSGIHCTTWKENTDAEFWKGDFAGSPYIGQQQTNGENSAQFCIELERDTGVTLKPGKSYRLTLTYCTQGMGKGKFYTQASDYSKTDSFNELNNTGDTWKTTDMLFTRGDISLRLLFDLTANGEGNTLLINQITITEVD